VNDPVGAIRDSPVLNDKEKEAILWGNIGKALR